MAIKKDQVCGIEVSSPWNIRVWVLGSIKIGEIQSFVWISVPKCLFPVINQHQVAADWLPECLYILQSPWNRAILHAVAAGGKIAGRWFFLILTAGTANDVGAAVTQISPNVVLISEIFRHPFRIGNWTQSCILWNISIIFIGIEEQRLAQLFLIGHTFRGGRSRSRLVQGRQQHRGQNGDDHYSIDIKLMSIGKYATYI